MFGSLGGSELLLILVLALLLFGPRRLPQIGRTIGRAMAEFRKATNDLRSSLEHEVRSDEIGQVRSGIESLNRDLNEAADSVSPRRIVERAIRGETGPGRSAPVAPEPPPMRPGTGGSKPAGPGARPADERAPSTAEPSPGSAEPSPTPAEPSPTPAETSPTSAEPSPEPKADESERKER
jgi:Tat protein translocase TatB subunit